MDNRKRYSGVLVKTKNKVLLCKRNNKGELPGEWSIPSGGIKEGESPVLAAKREYYEETNIVLDGNLELIGMLGKSTRDGQKYKGLLYVYLNNQDEENLPDLEEAVDGDEHTECSFFSRNELPKPLGSQLKELIMKII